MLLCNNGYIITRRRKNNMLGDLATRILSVLNNQQELLSVELSKLAGGKIQQTVIDLVEDGLVSMRTEGEGKTPRKFYAITSNGRRMLRMVDGDYGRAESRVPPPTQPWRPTSFTPPRGAASLVAFSLPSHGPTVKN